MAILVYFIKVAASALHFKMLGSVDKCGKIFLLLDSSYLTYRFPTFKLHVLFIFFPSLEKEFVLYCVNLPTMQKRFQEIPVSLRSHVYGAWARAFHSSMNVLPVLL